MPDDELQYNEEGFQIDENGDKVVDEATGEFIPKPVEKEPEVIEPTTEELKQQIVDLEKAVNGLKENTFEQRERRRVAEEEVTELKRQLNEKSGRSTEEQQEWEEAPLIRKDLAKLKEDLREERRKEAETNKQAALKAKDAADLAEARAGDKDFSKIEKMAIEVMEKDPDFKAGYNTTSNVAKYFQKIAKQHPEYEARLKQEARQEVVNNVKRGNQKVNTSPSGGGKGGGEDYSDLTLEEYNRMPVKQRVALPESVKERILGAND